MQTADSADTLPNVIADYDGTILDTLALINGVVATVPAHQLHALQEDERVSNVTIDAPVHNRESFITAPVQTLTASDVISPSNSDADVTQRAVYLPLITQGPADIRSFQRGTNVQSQEFSPILTLYENGMGEGWQVVPWATVDLTSTVVISTSQPSDDTEPEYAMAVDFAAGWDGLYLTHDTPIVVTDATMDVATMNTEHSYDTLAFWVHGGDAGGQELWVKAIGDTGADGTAWAASTVIIKPKANQWMYYEIPLSDLTGKMAGDSFQLTGATLAKYAPHQPAHVLS